MNAIAAIHPYRSEHGLWVFDDQRVGLDREPFVCGADAIIDRWVAYLPEANKGFDLLFSTSAKPLRIITLMSLSISILNVIYALYVVLILVVKDDVATGWASMSLQISGLFFLVCIILAVMSEYVLQILEATTQHPRYHIAAQRHSGMMQIARDRNVIATTSPDDATPGQPVLDQAVSNGQQIQPTRLK